MNETMKSILQKIAEIGSVGDVQLSEELNIDLDEVRFYLDELEKSDLIEQIKDSTFVSNGQVHRVLGPTNQGKLVAKGKIPQPSNSPKPQKTRILILSANPRGTSQLRLDEEMREIREGLRRAKQREEYKIYTAEAVRYRDIHRAILDYEPNIVHFSGHGAGEEGLVFEDETGQAKLVDAEALAGLFELFADQVECVVLNACYSKVQAQAIAQHINYVIGMSQAIGDRAAIEFAVGFYDALGAGRPVKFAYRLGCNLIRVAGIPENLTPQLLTKNYTPPPELEQEVNPELEEVANPELEQEVNLPSQSPRSQATASSLEPKLEQVELRSERGIDYTKLRDLLAAGEWKEANMETAKVMLQAADRERKGWLSVTDIDNFPCEDLRTINQLWLHYSKGKFGFSVQKDIYQNLGGTRKYNLQVWINFCERIGWRKKEWNLLASWRENWEDDSDLTFNLELAPLAHLPTGLRVIAECSLLSRKDL